MDGPATFRELRADPTTCHIPVLFMTARTQAAERARLAELGPEGIVAKPFDPLKLASDIAATLNWT
jgi:CheY-like chemotaxis protein